MCDGSHVIELEYNYNRNEMAGGNIIHVKMHGLNLSSLDGISF